MEILIPLLLDSLLIMFGLPALGLISFHGGFIAAILTTVVATFSSVILLTIFGGLARLEILGAVAGGLAAGGVPGGLLAGLVGLVIGVLLVCVAMAGSLWIASGLISGVALLGFWNTVFAALILAVATELSGLLTRALKARAFSN